MIHEIGRELEAQLLAKGCPFKVIDRETTKPTSWRNVIVIERRSDATGPARTQSINPKRYYTRYIGAKVTVYVQSTKSGALEFEHERIADRVVDLVQVALRKIAADRKQPIAFGRSELVKIPDLEASERLGGAVYELEFTVERSVADRTWTGAIAAEFEIGAGSFTNGTLVRRAHTEEDDGDPTTPETACGA